MEEEDQSDLHLQELELRGLQCFLQAAQFILQLILKEERTSVKQQAFVNYSF